MAGAITHLLVVEKAAEKLGNDIPEMAKAFAQAKPFLLLGAVSPDLPYSKVLSGQQIWADRMHYVHTNRVGIEGAVDFGQRNLLATPLGSAQLAWLAGYVAHCVTDATIHPIVQAMVGPYHVDPDRHRICEMVQDALTYDAVTGSSLHGKHFAKQLTECLHPDPKAFMGVVGFWFLMLKKAYPGADPWPNPQTWYEAYVRLIRVASDSEVADVLSRPFHRVQDYLYPSTEDLRKERGDEASAFFDLVPLAFRKDHSQSFMEQGFQRAIDNLLPAWKALIEDVQSAGSIASGKSSSRLSKILFNWNLDTGEEMDAHDRRVTYWPA